MTKLFRLPRMLRLVKILLDSFGGVEGLALLLREEGIARDTVLPDAIRSGRTDQMLGPLRKRRYPRFPRATFWDAIKVVQRVVDLKVVMGNQAQQCSMQVVVEELEYME